MYIFQFLTVSCIPAVGHVYQTFLGIYMHLLTFRGGYIRYLKFICTAADILWHVPGKVPDICLVAN